MIAKRNNKIIEIKTNLQNKEEEKLKFIVSKKNYKVKDIRNTIVSIELFI